MKLARTLAALALGVALLGQIPAAATVRGGSATPAKSHEAGEWLAGDLHVHTCYSHDAYCPPDDDNTGPDEFYTLGHTVDRQFTIAASRGLDYVAITDHNDIRSQADPGFGSHGVLGVRGYENSLSGHGQMLGATRIYDAGDHSAKAVEKMAKELRHDGGVFQANHPAADSVAWPSDPDWGYGYEVVPDDVEVWNIGPWLWQPPAPAANSNDDAVRYWEGWLDRGYHVAATGGSDNHWVSTTGVQGVGQPTTWVYASDRSEQGILDGLREGHTFISHEPPAYGGPRIFLEADPSGSGGYEAMMGDTVPAGTPVRVRVEGAAGSMLRVVTTNEQLAFPPVPVTSSRFEYRFVVPEDVTWARAEVFDPDAAEQRRAACDDALGDQTTYCRNALLILAMTSALYFEERHAPQTDVYGVVQPDRVILGNSLVERAWAAAPFGTQYALDKRTGLRTDPSKDFRLALAGGGELTGADFHVVDARVDARDDGSVSVRMELALTGTSGPAVTRTVTAFPGIAGFETRTAVSFPVSFGGYTLDELAIPGAAPEIQAFRAGYDWRGSDSPGWTPTVSPFGDDHRGDHRVSSRAPAGQALEGEGEWMTLAKPDGSRAFFVTQRVDYASTRMAYDGTTGRAAVDLSKDVLYTGPFESDVHAGSPAHHEARRRTILPGTTLELERVFTGFGVDPDDEPWQHFRYLSAFRAPPWSHDVVFNSNGVDANRISTGAKDDMDLAEVQRQAAVARQLGIDTFVLDDGWQAASGDWCPDSPQCPEPRGLYQPRFPDDRFAAVRDALGGMKLGLWMSPMEFNPSAQAHGRNPQWTCQPTGSALEAYNRADPNSSSNEAGLVPWNPEATDQDGRMIDFLERRIRAAIDAWHVRYFKFDFLVWLDCAGLDPVTMYDYRESFLHMLDRVIADHPDVTFQIDETNDYRLFPFESLARGATWYANGGPTVAEALHNLWILAPYVPPYALGQAVLGGDRGKHATDYLMAAALASHMTFFTDLTRLSADEVQTAAKWVGLYDRERDRLSTFTYPLLDDPLSGTTWTALQPWNPDTGRGALLVFRQGSPEVQRTIALRGIRGAGSYTLTDAMTGDVFGQFTADELRSGIDVPLPDRFTARVLLIAPV
ncbi:MAG: CehA/McbA family metallohydrolase [Actinomycetota bacterium]